MTPRIPLVLVVLSFACGLPASAPGSAEATRGDLPSDGSSGAMSGTSPAQPASTTGVESGAVDSGGENDGSIASDSVDDSASDSEPTTMTTTGETTDGTSAGSDATYASTASETSSTGGSTRATIPFCRQSCDAAEDCTAAGAQYDVENWLCSSGGCLWLGCLDDLECGPGMVCAPIDSDAGIQNFCVAECSTADDCGSGAGPYVAANYGCLVGACLFDGCAAEAECDEVATSLGCFPEHSDVCLQECDGPDDCGSGTAAWDEDNYECVDGACVYLGCNGDFECDPDQVCTEAP